MPRSKDPTKGRPDEIDLDDPEFIESFLKSVEALAAEAGDWRDHLPYDALIGYRHVAAIRERFEDHFTACKYCQELEATLLRRNKPRPWVLRIGSEA